MVRLITILLSIIVATFFTIKAFWLQLNGVSTIDIINRLPVLFAPSNYVFIIWIILYLYLFLWVFKLFRAKKIEEVTSAQTLLFVANVILQVAAIFSWHYEQFVVALLLIALQCVALFLLYLTYPLNRDSIQKRYPIAVYLSWSFFLFIFNCCYVLVYIQWAGFGLSNALWCVLAMTIGTAAVIHLRYHYSDIISPIVFIWCFIGIAVSNGFDELLVATAALFLCGVMIVAILFAKKNPVSST